MECPKCHSSIDDKLTVCSVCKKVIALECPNCKSLSGSSVCQKCGYTILVKCAKCSKINPYKNEVCSKCGFSLADSLAYLECENDDFASIVVEFASLKKIRIALKSQEMYVKFLNRIKNLLTAQLKNFDGRVISYNNIYAINFNRELSLATSSNKAIRK